VVPVDELRRCARCAIAFVTKLIDDGKVFDNSMERMLIHGIAATDVMAELGALNKLNADT
jgi:hypothetical protein